MLKIISVPHKTLSTPTKPVKKIDDSIRDLVRQMEATLVAQTDPMGVGLAANQVNRPLSLFIIKTSKKAATKAFINPRVLEMLPAAKPKTKSGKKAGVKLEGCLSIPRIWGPVGRSGKVLLEYHDAEGKPHKDWFSGFEATVIQHEMDHLSGVVFTQRSMEQKRVLYKEIDGELKEFEI